MNGDDLTIPFPLRMAAFIAAMEAGHGAHLSREELWTLVPAEVRQILEWAAQEAEAQWGGVWIDQRPEDVLSPVEAGALACLRAALPPSLGFTA